MNSAGFARLLDDFTHAAESGDGARFASHFTPDATYHDYIYGPHTGRDDIAHMMQGLFHRDAADYRWEMRDPVFDGTVGYAWSLSSFTSTIPQFAGRKIVIDGMSRFIVQDGLIAEYRESVNGGVAMQQLGVAPEKMAQVFERWAGWLTARPETREYLARPRGSRAKAQFVAALAVIPAHDAEEQQQGDTPWLTTTSSTTSPIASRRSRSTGPTA